TADDGVDLAAPRELGEVAGVLLERLELPFRLLIRDAVGAADLREGAEEAIVGKAVAVEDGLDVLVRLGGRQQEMLDRDEVVLERLRLVLGFLKERVHAPAQTGLCAAAHFRQALELLLDLAPERARLSPRSLDERRADAVALLEN